MTVDWDGQIRMDPSSIYSMQRLIGMKDRFDLAFACDTDHDRHGIVTRSSGLLPPTHYLCAAIFYLYQHRPKWRKAAAVGTTVVSSQMIARVTAKLERKFFEVPVGFKWFVDGLLGGATRELGDPVYDRVEAPATLARPSGTESVYKIYAESFQGPEHLRLLLGEGQQIVADTLATAKAPQGSAGRPLSARPEGTP